MKKNEYQNPLTDETHGEYTWCLHCEQAFKTELWVVNHWNCPGKKCDGSILDANSWAPDSWPMETNSDYPLVPVEGKRYPLYGKKNK